MKELYNTNVVFKGVIHNFFVVSFRPAMRLGRSLPLEAHMPEPTNQRFCLVEVEAGRVALCRMHGDPIEAKDWKEARTKVPEGAFAAREGHGYQAGETE